VLRTEWMGHPAFVAESSALSRPPERTCAQVEKKRYQTENEQESPVAWTVRPACSHSPELGSKGNRRQQEENAGDLQPYDAAYAPKRP